jgi:hypothetical protein
MNQITTHRSNTPPSAQPCVRIFNPVTAPSTAQLWPSLTHPLATHITACHAIMRHFSTRRPFSALEVVAISTLKSANSFQAASDWSNSPKLPLFPLPCFFPDQNDRRSKMPHGSPERAFPVAHGRPHVSAIASRVSSGLRDSPQLSAGLARAAEPATWRTFAAADGRGAKPSAAEIAPLGSPVRACRLVQTQLRRVVVEAQRRSTPEAYREQERER